MRTVVALVGSLSCGMLTFNGCGGESVLHHAGGSGGRPAKGGKAGTQSLGDAAADDGAGDEGGSTSGVGPLGDTGGKGGQLGRGGKFSGRAEAGGTGGSSGTTAGAAGESGAAGSGGTGGAGRGGSSGTGGTSGFSGAAGEGAGSGADGGTGGALPPIGPACAYECDDAYDCDPFVYVYCDPIQHRCRNYGSGCATHDDCALSNDFHLEVCVEDSDCDVAGDLCVVLQGEGRCARPPASTGCPVGEPVAVRHFSRLEDIVVCGTGSARCENGACVEGCTIQPDYCTVYRGLGPVCDPVSGRCGGCRDDDDCTGWDVSHCNRLTGFCECAGDADCAARPDGRNTCVDGACSCSGPEACANSRYTIAHCE